MEALNILADTKNEKPNIFLCKKDAKRFLRRYKRFKNVYLLLKKDDLSEYSKMRDLMYENLELKDKIALIENKKSSKKHLVKENKELIDDQKELIEENKSLTGMVKDFDEMHDAHVNLSEKSTKLEKDLSERDAHVTYLKKKIENLQEQYKLSIENPISQEIACDKIANYETMLLNMEEKINGNKIKHDELIAEMTMKLLDADTRNIILEQQVKSKEFYEETIKQLNSKIEEYVIKHNDLQKKMEMTGFPVMNIPTLIIKENN